MQIKKNLFLLALILTFILGLYATMFFKIDICSDCKENMENANDTDESSCPDVLIKKDDQILLYNSKDPSSENNPRVLSNLDEYIKYLETQREKGINCPVLYLQQESNAQGEDVIRYDLCQSVPPRLTFYYTIKNILFLFLFLFTPLKNYNGTKKYRYIKYLI